MVGITKKWAACALVALGVTAPAALPAQSIEAMEKWGIRIEPTGHDTTAAVQSVRETLLVRLATEERDGAPPVRVLTVSKQRDGDNFEAQVFNYGEQQAYSLTVDASSRELARHPIDYMFLGDGEYEAAEEMVMSSREFAAAIRAGEAFMTAPMPPITKGPTGERLVNVGLQWGTDADRKQEIVSVDFLTGTIHRFEAGGPPLSVPPTWDRGSCGPNSAPCNISAGSTNPFSLSWPSDDPVWEMNVIRPGASRPAYGNLGGGIVLTNVRHKGRLIFDVVHVPILNVEYEDNLCGPYRDWQYAEHCFQVSDAPANTGVIFSENTVSETICKVDEFGNHSDAGNFRGVSIGIVDGNLHMITEMSAGWYRYLMGYTFTMDGEMLPEFGFGTTAAGCVCISRYHHAYFRFELALDGTSGNYTTGKVDSYRVTDASAGTKEKVLTEATGYRTLPVISHNKWLFQNADTGLAIELTPGKLDGTAEGDPFAEFDYAILAFNQNAANHNEADDPGNFNFTPKINLSAFVNGESVSDGSKRTVFWYHANFDRDTSVISADDCEFRGPTIRVLPPVSEGFLVH